ncbi:multisubunit potassium/proton antiporter PhaD subunit [Aliiruegeria haliotis]|uniref:Multisubunit potassium/proton antiporter PhaD subunit n=1 Tax=Aliiruegeria haliotis TaxID=1280846 RepID=A0A2T0RVW4_9RHOB|nr:monovalent cation/H+ antiporter subunit D [Aliiruegeria haliotis]PRY25304.1 multisubunit potassium/proton antiporter PhaD subunit [Aliiruegeria haliotis]
MNHWIIFPVILPAMFAPVMAMAMRHDLLLQRVFSIAGTVAMMMISIGLFISTLDGSIEVYTLGNWEAPFGIVLVLDRLSATMLVLSSLLAFGVVLYAIGSSWDSRGRHFHPLFAFQMMGVNGAFLTGDAFNLFVFFEVLLIASYGLMIHAGGAMRLRSGLQYVVMNLVGSTLFLFAMGTLYAVLGTLNMADMAVKARGLAPGDQGLLLVGAMLLLIVFSIKAAAFPVQFWLPATYSNAAPPVAALFAIMTKVGAYAIIRVYTLIFGADTVGTVFTDLLLPVALVTLCVGAIGVLGSRQLPRQVSFAVLASMGTLLLAISLDTEQATTAALYYMVHSTFAAGAMFVILDMIRQSQGNTEQAPGGLVTSLFFVAAIAMAGMPPLSGFVGKLLILDASRTDAWMPWIWAVILVTSLMTIVGFALRGSRYMWKPLDPNFTFPENLDEEGLPIAAARIPGLAVTAACIPLGLLVVLTILAGPVAEMMRETAVQLRDTAGYITAVLGPQGGS